MRRSPWSELMANVNKTRIVVRGRKDKQPKVEITENDLRVQFQKQGGRCYWLGVKLNPKDIFRSYYPLSMSVDRLDNSRGYTVDNIVITSRFANLGRGKCDVKEFKKIMKKVKGTVRHGKN